MAEISMVPHSTASNRNSQPYSGKSGKHKQDDCDQNKPDSAKGNHLQQSTYRGTGTVSRICWTTSSRLASDPVRTTMR